MAIRRLGCLRAGKKKTPDGKAGSYPNNTYAQNRSDTNDTEGAGVRKSISQTPDTVKQEDPAHVEPDVQTKPDTGQDATKTDEAAEEEVNGEALGM